jgi:tetratricopeptide (TPR) repeat protein
MFLGLESNLNLWQFLLLFLIFIVVLTVAYILLTSMLRQEKGKAGRNWNTVGVFALILPPVLGIGAILGISMFSFFINQLHYTQATVKHRVFIRNIGVQERQLQTLLTSEHTYEALTELQQFLMQLEGQERDWDNPELWKKYDRWSQRYLSLLFLSGDYQGIIDWDSTRIRRYPDLAVFPAMTAIALESMGKDGAFWANYVKSSNMKGDIPDFMTGYTARCHGLPDSARKTLPKLNVNNDPINILAIAAQAERARTLTDLGRYEQAREIVVQQLEPLLQLSDYPIIQSYIKSTRCYVEIHYFVAQYSAEFEKLSMVENKLKQAIEDNPKNPESWVLLSMYYFLNHDNGRAIYYFDDIKARAPWLETATSRFLTKIYENGQFARGNVHLFLMERIELGLRGQLVGVR